MMTMRTVSSSKATVEEAVVGSGTTLHHIRAEVEVAAAGMLKLCRNTREKIFNTFTFTIDSFRKVRFTFDLGMEAVVAVATTTEVVAVTMVEEVEDTLEATVPFQPSFSKPNQGSCQYLRLKRCHIRWRWWRSSRITRSCSWLGQELPGWRCLQLVCTLH